VAYRGAGARDAVLRRALHPAAAMVSESAQDHKINHGIAFALTNLPYLLLGAACLATLCGMPRTRPPEAD
jgi:hypothetical protein